MKPNPNRNSGSHHRTPKGQRDPRRGVITILLAICCIAMMALAGLATDLAACMWRRMNCRTIRTRLRLPA